MKSYRNIAVIPARSKSKRLKDKNIKKLDGIPLLGHAVMQAKKTQLFDEIVVSTDSASYSSIAESYGANILNLRPTELSEDDSSSWDVVRHVLKILKDSGKVFDYLVLLQPTSPLRTPTHIVEALNLAHKGDLDFLASVNKTEIKPHLINNLRKDYSLYNFIQKSSQDNTDDEFYKLNGAIYIVKVECLVDDNFINSKKSRAYVMPEINSIDIDTEFDLEIATFLYNKFL